MPTRLIREGILDSSRVNRLSSAAEIFYRRLMSVVDDFGRFDARLSFLRARCYPLRLDSVSDETVLSCLGECIAAQLICIYAQNGHPQTEPLDVSELPIVADGLVKRPYLQILDFRQKIRANVSRFPDPPPGMDYTCPADAGQMRYVGPSVGSHRRSEAEAKAESETGGAEANGDPLRRKDPSGPPANKPRQKHFEGPAEPRPDALDADYDNVEVPLIQDDADLAAITDPIIAAMAVTGDRVTQSWRGWVRLASVERIRLGRAAADGIWLSVCNLFWHEMRAGEIPRCPGAALTAQLKRRLGEAKP